MIKMSNTYDENESFDGTIKEFGEWLNKYETKIECELNTEQSVADFIENHLTPN